jgi:hypothetical protein
LALPAISEDPPQPSYKEILSFSWTKTINTETFQRRKLVARKQLLASFDKGRPAYPNKLKKQLTD